MQRILPYLLAMGSSIGLIAAALAALAQDLPGNIASGRHLAESWCTRCHEIYLDEFAPFSYPPNFVEIANMPSTTALAINVFLRTSHDVMPNYQLSREEVDDIVAFIMSLKDRKVR
jgi:mono/diheme cytochrome c family protein